MPIAKHENLNDIVVWNRTAFCLVDVMTEYGDTIFSPDIYGIQATPICNECKRGFYCRFHVANDSLILTKLNIMAANDFYPKISGITPSFCSADHSMEYRKIREPVKFSGTIRVGLGQQVSRYDWRQHIDPKQIKSLWDLEFSNGKLLSAINQMPLVAMSQHNLPIAEYSASYANDAYGVSDIPYFHLLNHAKVSLAFRKTRKPARTPKSFIQNYARLGLSQQLTLEYLDKLGISPQLSKFLRELVSETQTEKMIVLEVIETMLQTVASNHWEERVHPGHLYQDAYIPASLTATIRGRLAGISMTSWKQAATSAPQKQDT